MSLNTWLHCNTCFTVYSSKIRIFITNCKHVFCGDCINLSTVCFVCKKKFKSIELTKNAPEEVKVLFKPIDKEIKKISNIWNFQMEQKIKFLNHSQRSMNQMKQVDAEIMQMKTKYKKIADAIGQEQNLIRCLEKFENLTPKSMHSYPDIQIKKMFDSPDTDLTPDIKQHGSGRSGGSSAGYHSFQMD